MTARAPGAQCRLQNELFSFTWGVFGRQQFNEKNWHEIISSVIIKDKRKKKTLTDAASMLGRDCLCCWYDLVAAVRNEKFEGDME